MDNELRSYMDDMRQDLSIKIDEVGSKLSLKIDEVDTKLSSKIDEVDTKLSLKIDEVDTKLSLKIDEVDTKIDTLQSFNDHQFDDIRQILKTVCLEQERMDQRLELMEHRIIVQLDTIHLSTVNLIGRVETLEGKQ